MRYKILKREDIINLYNDITNNENIDQVHIPLPNVVTMLDLLGIYANEDSSIFHKFNDPDKKMPLLDRLENLYEEMKKWSNIVEETRNKVRDNEVLTGKLYGIQVATEEQVSEEQKQVSEDQKQDGK